MIFFFLAELHGKQDHSVLTGDRTYVVCNGSVES